MSERTRRRRAGLRSVVIIFGVLYSIVYSVGKRRMRWYPGGALFELLLRDTDSGRCPTVREVLETQGNAKLVAKIWKDPNCASGCVFKECRRLAVPCCVNSRAKGMVNEAIFVCSRQIDNSLLYKIHTSRLTDLVNYCRHFLALELYTPDCTHRRAVVPKILHAIGRDEEAPRHLRVIAQENPSYTLHYSNDETGLEFIRSNCGEEAALAYECIKPPAFRADLYRFCATFSQGGVYLDTDVLPLVKLEEMFSKCSSFTLGYDQAQKKVDIDHIGMQMKIIAGRPNNNISKCMISAIVQHVRKRKQFTKDTLGFSGPQLLRKCYLKFSDDVAVTYMDTRGADWPFSGLRAGAQILAYEIPSASRHFDEIITRDEKLEYNDMVRKRDIYTQSCQLH